MADTKRNLNPISLCTARVMVSNKRLKAFLDTINAFNEACVRCMSAMAEIALIVDSMPKNVQFREINATIRQVDKIMQNSRKKPCKIGWGYRSKLYRPNHKPKPKPYWLRIRSRLW